MDPNLIFGPNYLPTEETLLPESLAKVKASLEAGAAVDDPIAAAVARNRTAKVAVSSDERNILEKLFGEARELDAVHARLAKAAAASDAADVSVEAVRHRTLSKLLLGDPSEFEVAPEAGADPAWQWHTPLLRSSGSADARLSRPQRRSDVFREPQKAEGEPLAHPDGAVTRSWPEGSMTVIWKDGKIVGSRTEYLSADGAEVEFYDGLGDEITEGEYARLVA